MPRLTFEEPLAGPLARAARRATEKSAQETATRVEAEPPGERPTEQLADLFVTEEDERAGRHRRAPERRDTVLVALKAATVVVGLALVGLVILLTTSGEDQPGATSPAVPDIPASEQRSSGPATTTPDVGAMVAPPVHSDTTEIVPPPTVTEPTTTEPPGGDQTQFVRVGEPCDTRGAYAFTERYEPVVCGGRRHNGPLVWRPMFR
jgi:hypothetical protein